jgi:alpha-ketoglutarate-dependent taurine dioxygenase
METFRAYYTDIRASDWQQQAAAQLRERGLLTFSGITERAGLIGLARQLMTIRPHRDADAEGVTVITKTRDESSGYAGFTDAELIPHTDGSAESNPPGLLLLACQQAADEGGSTQVADGAHVTRALAEQHPAALGPLSAPQAAFFGTAGAYLGAPLEPAGPGRKRIRLRLDELAWFSTEAAGMIPLLRVAIAAHTRTFRLREGDGLLLSNTRWLHGRDNFVGHRSMLRVLGDPLPATGILPGFPSHPSFQGHCQVDHSPGRAWAHR